MNSSVIGLDIAKHIFHLFTLGIDGKTTKKKLKRNELLAVFANYPVSIIGIEACGSAHHWARELTKLGVRRAKAALFQWVKVPPG